MGSNNTPLTCSRQCLTVDFIRDALAQKGASATAFLQWAASKGMFAGRKQRLEELPAQHYAASVNAIAQFKKA